MRGNGNVLGIIGAVNVGIVGNKAVYLLCWFSEHAIARNFIIRLLRRLIFKGIYGLCFKSIAF